MKKIFALSTLTLLFLMGCKKTTPERFVIDFSIVASQVCLKVNAARPAIMDENTDLIITAAQNEDWSEEKTRSAIDRINFEDALLRKLVSPIGDPETDLLCKRASKDLYEKARPNIDWTIFGKPEFRDAFQKVLNVMKATNTSLEKLGTNLDDQLAPDRELRALYGQLLEYGRAIQIQDWSFLRKSSGFDGGAP